MLDHGPVDLAEDPVLPQKMLQELVVVSRLDVIIEAKIPGLEFSAGHQRQPAVMWVEFERDTKRLRELDGGNPREVPNLREISRVKHAPVKLLDLFDDQLVGGLGSVRRECLTCQLCHLSSLLITGVCGRHRKKRRYSDGQATGHHDRLPEGLDED